MKDFTADMSASEKTDARAIFDYEIAKLICEQASSYFEMLEILDTIKLQLDIVRDLAELKLEDAPRNKWREKLPVPGAKGSGTGKGYLPGMEPMVINEERKKHGLTPISGGDVAITRPTV